MAIENGGVEIWANDNLCYLDLMQWERLVPYAALVSYFQKPAACLTLECDAGCTCDYCGGPGKCAATCSTAMPAWTAAPILGGMLLVLLVGLLLYGCATGFFVCLCSVSRRPMLHRKTTSFVATSSAEASWVSGNTQRQPGLAVSTDLPRLLNGPSTAVTAFPSQQVAPRSDNELPEPLSAGEQVLCICGKLAEFDCSRCTKQAYCSSECQRADWKRHRDHCRQFVEQDRVCKNEKNNEN